MQKKAAVRKEKNIAKHPLSPKTVTLKAVGSDQKEAIQEAPKSKNIGEVLKLVRESKGESMKEIGEVLRIGEHYLRAIEKMDVDGLPEQVYTLGFVRSYAHYLGVDPQKSVTQFKNEFFSTTLNVKKLNIPQPVDATSLPTKKILWGTAVVLLIALGAGYVYWGKSHLSLDHEISTLLMPLEETDVTTTPTLIEPDFSQEEPETFLEQPNL